MPAFCGVAVTVSRQQKRHPNQEGQGVEDTTFLFRRALQSGFAPKPQSL